MRTRRIALVVRTRRPFYRSRPGTLLLTSTAGLIGLDLRGSVSTVRGDGRACAAAWSARRRYSRNHLLYVTAAELTKRRLHVMGA
jgi:hypothetical protein